MKHKIEKYNYEQVSGGFRLLLLAIGCVIIFHGGLLPFTHGNTYDAYIHMFFADHYNRSWFDVWEPRWYTGFATTSYPPGTHMLIGGLQYIMPLRAAYVVVQICGLILLVIGVFRYSLIWVQPRVAGYAVVLLVLATSISQTVHLFGQLPMIFSLGMFLNGLPYFFRWIVYGKYRNLIVGVVFAAATTALHHVTTIFGGIFFVLPLAVQSLRAFALAHTDIIQQGYAKDLLKYWRPLGRGFLLAILMGLAVLVTVFPYWYWSITDPITQVPIPHGSRENFLERIDLGIVFFLIPWGLSLLFLPVAIYQGMTSALWPLMLSVVLCFLLGTGGTTPLPQMILRGAFDILTLDRFTFWGSILILPFGGMIIDSLLHGRSREIVKEALGAFVHRFLVGSFFILMGGLSTFIAILPTIKATQPDFIDPEAIVRFMEEDEHDRWRYLTLGFGDQFAYLSSKMTAKSVDGNYHSARRLPDLTNFSVERLENAKYLGIPGLGSLAQFIINADAYNLKYIFSNDEFYDPLLFFNGWNAIKRFSNNVVIWEKPDVTALALYQPRKDIPVVHAFMWGLLPPLVLLSAFLILLHSLAYVKFIESTKDYHPVIRARSAYAKSTWARKAMILGMLGGIISILAVLLVIIYMLRLPSTPQEVVKNYFTHLDFRRFEKAYNLFDPELRPPYQEALFKWKWKGGLLNSYGKLEDIKIVSTKAQDNVIDYDVELTYITSLSRVVKQKTMRVIKRGSLWYIAPVDLQQAQVPVRLQRQIAVAWNNVGRRQPRWETDLHRDRLDRPRIAIDYARLVKYNDRYYIIGQVFNSDYDAAALSIFGVLFSDRELLARKSAGNNSIHRLLPAESAGFRIKFDGVLSLIDQEGQGSFDPEQFIPPRYINPPTKAKIEARALVKTENLYRSISLNSLNFSEDEHNLIVKGIAVNTGTQTASIIQVNFLLYDEKKRPRWVEARYIDTNIYPGQSRAFEFRIPIADTITPIADIGLQEIKINGSVQYIDSAIPKAQNATIPLDSIGGYSYVRIMVSSMTYDPLR